MKMMNTAVPVWGENLTEKYNQFLGFRTELELEKETDVTICLAARTYYRLYIDGKMIMNGPARTADGYCRIDETTRRLSGKVKIAIEVDAYSTSKRYCNDNTMEPGVLAVEIYTTEKSGEKKLLTYTEDDTWRYTELSYRAGMTDLMSHCRGIVEYYRLNPSSFDWITQEEETGTYNFQKPVPVQEENKFLEKLQKESDTIFRGSYNKTTWKGQPAICITESEGNPASTFSIDKSEVGFLHLMVSVEEKTVLDLMNSDYLDEEGALKANSYVCRYELEPGDYDLLTMEPKLCKYVKIVARTKGKVTFTYPELLDDTYPDQEENEFRCSDGNLNKIYQAAKRTLRLNTLDIFMDCPERERGGWLCDSYFSGYAAWQLFGDHRVEKDFIENFLLTDGNIYRDGFFPEVYPGVHENPADPGIESWSFWLIAELYSYVKRSGDKTFAEKYFRRIETFLNGVENHLGESGLFEKFTILFVDWSLSNHKICLEPICMPVNCLIVRAYELMGDLYG